MAKNPQKQEQEQVISSKRHFHWTKKVGNEDSDEEKQTKPTIVPKTTPHKKLSTLAISRVRSILTTFNKNRLHSRSHSPHLGSRVVGTLFGHRRGHVHFAFQTAPNTRPAFLVELDTPISGLVKEMASGLVRIALECDKKKNVAVEKTEEVKKKKLLEERVWRSYCNGKKCGFASRRECGEKEWKVLKSVEPISMGAGVLPGDGDDEIMYMRAKFERVVGSRDSEAFYMMNPDSNGAPELSIYLLRV